jgi:hypothetical protein
MNKSISLLLLFCTAFLLFLPVSLFAQVFHFSDGEQNHRIFMDNSYLIETVYQQKDGAFAFTRGGFYQKSEKGIEVTFEFNSNYAQDSLKILSYADQDWRKVSKTDQALEGKWLMAGRVKPKGEQRRDLNRSRKTMKLLLDGYFQWTAFDTASMRFMGSGGGTYTAQDGNYVETLEYFSRDNSKVGKVLPFEFFLKENDWYHKGLNSKDQSMHEIWQKRSNQ